MRIRNFRKEDFPFVQNIYQEGIDTKNATFETIAPGWEQWNLKFLSFCRLVTEDRDGGILGWAALSLVSARRVYEGVCEVSVYVHPGHTGKGIGKMLLAELVRESEVHKIWTLQSSVFPENKASIKIHLDCGFREVGYRERIAPLDGVWRNTILLERRSRN